MLPIYWLQILLLKGDLKTNWNNVYPLSKEKKINA